MVPAAGSVCAAANTICGLIACTDASRRASGTLAPRYTTSHPRRRSSSASSSGPKVCCSSGGQTTNSRPCRTAEAIDDNKDSSCRTASADAKCSCCTLTRPSYQPAPICCKPFCSSSKQTVSIGKIANACATICCAVCSSKRRQAAIHASRSASIRPPDTSTGFGAGGGGAS